jgi:GT2 family glycosyltransferase
MSNQPLPTRSVIVCAYTLDRLSLTERCIQAVLDQDPAPDQVIAVIDHNDELRARIRETFPTIDVVANSGRRGLSDARNTGIAQATGEILAFIDDDAIPARGWLAGLTEGFADPSVMIVGGRANAAWERRQPGWFPDEYLWVVGCSYRGQPASGPVRNPLGCNMAFRREVFERVGGFDPAVGRLGTRPIGAEETELCLRTRQAFPAAGIVLVPGAEVSHSVPASRGQVSYFVRRCFYEGVSKAAVRDLGAGDALSTERGYVLRTLTSGVARRLGRAIRLDHPLDALAGIVALGTGAATAAAGYAYGRIARRTPRRVAEPTETGSNPQP